MIIITIIIYLIETSTGKCGYAGRNLRMYNTGYCIIGSKSKYSSVQRTQVTQLKDKGESFNGEQKLVHQVIVREYEKWALRGRSNMV